MEDANAKAAMQKFAAISPIHGCSYIANRSQLWEAILWVLVLIVCFSMCVRDTVNLVRSYQSGATAVSVKMQRDDSLQMKNAAICFDVLRQGIDIGMKQNF